MLSLEQALQNLLSDLRPLEVETIPLSTASGRFLAEPIEAPHPLPLIDNSAMDGWAVRSADIFRATPDRPVPLRIIAEIPAGKMFEAQIGPRQCARIFTGSPVPAGADAVVMQEDSRVDPGE